MLVKKEYDFRDLINNSWSGAISTLKRIEELGLENELMNILEMVFDYKIPTDTELNDFLWFEDDYINELLERNAETLYDDEKFEIEELDSYAYESAIEAYISEYCAYTNDFENVNGNKKVFSELTEEEVTAIEEAIEENGITFDKEGEIIYI